MQMNNESNLLTVVCLTYNHRNFIAQAIKSFISQKTTFPFGILIADDCSTDGTQEIVRYFKDKYPSQITAIFRERNLGPYDNSVDAYSRVVSDYFIYCDGDDYFLDPLKLQKQVDFLEQNSDYSICFHPVQVHSECNPITIFPNPEQRFNKTTLDLHDLLLENFIQTNSCMYRWRFGRKERLTDIFPKNITPGDYILHLLHAENGKIKFLDETMSVYRRWSGGIWHGAGVSDEWFAKLGEKHMRFFMELEKRYNVDKKSKIFELAVKTLIALSNKKDYAALKAFRLHYPQLFAAIMTSFVSAER